MERLLYLVPPACYALGMATFTPYKNYFYTQFHGLSSMVVTTVGNEQSSPGFIHRPNIRESYTLHFCLEGTGTLTANTRDYPVQVGDLMLIYPGVKIQPQADFDDPWNLCWVGFSGSDARLLTDAVGFSPLQPVISMAPESWERIRSAFFDIYESRGDRPAQLVGMTGKLYSCLSFLMTQTHTPFPRKPGFAYIEPALTYIAENYHKNITVSDIAQAVGISRSSLYRTFRANLAVNVQQYLTEYRIRVSCSLLEDGSIGLKEIAYRCGYANALYYSQVFKRVMGLSPTQYRDHLSR